MYIKATEITYSFCGGGVHTHILVTQIENKEISIPVSVLAPLSSVISLRGVGTVSSEEQIHSCICFHVLKVSWGMELNVAVSIKSGGDRELREDQTNY